MSEAPRARLQLTALVVLFVVVFDQLTKHWAVTSLPGRDPVHVVWTLQWNLAFNSGMSFSKGKSLGVVIGFIALIVTAYVGWMVRRNTSKSVAVAAGLVMGGALGNVVDRLFRNRAWMRGSVVDFIDFQWFPIFNVADMAVNVGAALFVIWSLVGARRASAS
jgi:signal peptidase II